MCWFKVKCVIIHELASTTLIEVQHNQITIIIKYYFFLFREVLYLYNVFKLPINLNSYTKTMLGNYDNKGYAYFIIEIPTIFWVVSNILILSYRFEQADFFSRHKNTFWWTVNE